MKREYFFPDDDCCISISCKAGTTTAMYPFEPTNALKMNVNLKSDDERLSLSLQMKLPEEREVAVGANDSASAMVPVVLPVPEPKELNAILDQTVTTDDVLAECINFLLRIREATVDGIEGEAA